VEPEQMLRGALLHGVGERLPVRVIGGLGELVHLGHLPFWPGRPHLPPDDRSRGGSRLLTCVFHRTHSSRAARGCRCPGDQHPPGDLGPDRAQFQLLLALPIQVDYQDPTCWNQPSQSSM
jgi:hypothetical protein